MQAGGSPAIFARQRELSADILKRGLAGNLTKNHAANESGPTLWLQDDRYAATPAVVRVLWEWPSVVNVMALPKLDELEADLDTRDHLRVDARAHSFERRQTDAIAPEKREFGIGHPGVVPSFGGPPLKYWQHPLAHPPGAVRERVLRIRRAVVGRFALEPLYARRGS